MNQQNKEKEYYDKAKKALANNDCDVAINEFTKAIEINPTKADTFNNRGVVYEKKGELNKAISDYTSAIKVFPKDKDKIILAKTYHNRGCIFFNRKKYDQSIEDFTKAIELNPNFIDAYFNRGNAYFNKKYYDKAIKDYTKAIEIDPNYKIKINPSLAETFKRQGFSSVRNGEYDDAIEKYSKAIDFQPNDSGAYFERGVVFANKPDYTNAINDFNMAIELNPNNAGAYYNRGLIFDMSGDINNLNKAIDDYSKAIKLNPYHISAYSRRGLAYAEIGEYDKAIEDYNTVIESNHKNSEAYNNRGYFYTEKKEYDKAIEDLNISIKLNQKNEQAYNNIGRIYNEQGFANDNEKYFDEAIINFTKAIVLKPNYAVAYNNLGSAYCYKCVIFLNKIIECRKKNIAYHQHEDAAIINYDKAVANFTKAIELKPDYIKAYNNRGRLYEIKGEHDKAKKDFIKANSLPPNRIDSSTKRNKYNSITNFASTIKDLQDAPEISTQLLYKYRAVNKNTLSALINESIWVASPKTFNDPLDGSYLYDKIQDSRFKKDLEGIGIISFESNEAVKGGVNTLMWSHYANSHKGICLIYKRVECHDDEQVNCKNNRILKVKYEDDIPLRLDTTEDMLETGFRTKHRSWEYEDEFRLILHQEEINKGSLFTTKELGLSIVGVIFGMECDDENRIKNILDRQDVKYYKIKQEVKHRVIKHLQLIKRRM